MAFHSAHIFLPEFGPAFFFFLRVNKMNTTPRNFTFTLLATAYVQGF